MTNDKELKKFINQERTCLTDIRMELNKLVDKHLNRLDKLELELTKKEQANPIQIDSDEQGRQGKPDI